MFRILLDSIIAGIVSAIVTRCLAMGAIFRKRRPVRLRMIRIERETRFCFTSQSASNGHPTESLFSESRLIIESIYEA